MLACAHRRDVLPDVFLALALGKAVDQSLLHLRRAVACVDKETDAVVHGGDHALLHFLKGGEDLLADGKLKGVFLDVGEPAVPDGGGVAGGVCRVVQMHPVHEDQIARAQILLTERQIFNVRLRLFIAAGGKVDLLTCGGRFAGRKVARPVAMPRVVQAAGSAGDDQRGQDQQDCKRRDKPAALQTELLYLSAAGATVAGLSIHNTSS